MHHSERHLTLAEQRLDTGTTIKTQIQHTNEYDFQYSPRSRFFQNQWQQNNNPSNYHAQISYSPQFQNDSTSEWTRAHACPT